MHEGRVDLYWLPLGAGGHCVQPRSPSESGRSPDGRHYGVMRSLDVCDVQVVPAWFSGGLGTTTLDAGPQGGRA
jgi:hypothetical protein